MKTFEPNKTIKELGIDISRKFVVVDDTDYSFSKGEILTLDRDDGSRSPSFKNKEGLSHYVSLYRLSYANRTLRDIVVGDTITDRTESFSSKVLAVCGEVFCSTRDSGPLWKSFYDAEKMGWHLKEETDTKAEECIAYLEKVGRITDGKIVR